MRILKHSYDKKMIIFELGKDKNDNCGNLKEKT